jgi:5-methylcytosine-specific restriction endonuclease McrA
MTPALPHDLSTACFVRDGWRCRHCRRWEDLHPHHMVYKSQGGADTLENLICLCFRCHTMHHLGNLDIAWGTDGGNGSVTFTRGEKYR